MDQQRWGVKEKSGFLENPIWNLAACEAEAAHAGADRALARPTASIARRGPPASSLAAPTNRRRRSRMPCMAAASCSMSNVAIVITPNSSTLAEQIFVYFRWTRIVQRHAVDLTRQGAKPGAYAKAVRARGFPGRKFIENSGSLIAADRYRSEIHNQLGYVACSS